MKIGLDLTWMSMENQFGGVFQYGMRLLLALTKYTDNIVVVIASDDCEALFDHLRKFENFHLVIKPSSSCLASIVEAEKIDIIHTPIQHFVNLTLAVPMITTLHDLQPFHFPEFFTPAEIEARNIQYGRSAEFSERVIVTFQHVKDDIVRFYKISPEKIDVCLLGMPEVKPVTSDEIDSIKQKYNLPERYLFYSANMWRHKNHIGLLRGLKILHERYGLVVPLICTGYQYPEFFPQVEAMVTELGLTENVRFLGYLPEGEMPAILAEATLAVIPTLYEAGSYPLMEAMVQGVPVICSTTTSLPDTIGDLRFVFDPNSPEEMAEKMFSMLTNEELCRENVANSKAKVLEATWEKGVKSFEEAYRRAIEGFAGKKKQCWYEDWALNFEFFVNDNHLRDMLLLSDQHYIETQSLNKRVVGVESTEKLLNEANQVIQRLMGSFSWKITRPIRWILDKLKSYLR